MYGVAVDGSRLRRDQSGSSAQGHPVATSVAHLVAARRTVLGSRIATDVEQLIGRLRAAYWGQHRRPRAGEEVKTFEYSLRTLLEGEFSEPDGFWRVTLDGHEWLLLVFGEAAVLHHVQGQTSETCFVGPLRGAKYEERFTYREDRYRLDARFGHPALPGSKPLTLSVELDPDAQHPEVEALRRQFKAWASRQAGTRP